MQKKQVLVLGLFLAGMLIIYGCGQNAQKPAPYTNPETGAQQTTASRFSTMAMEVEGVQKATVVVG